MSDEERVKLIIQIASNFGISYDEASYIIKSFENFLEDDKDKLFEKIKQLMKEINEEENGNE